MDSISSPDLLADLQEEIVFEHATKTQRFVNFLIDLIVYYIFVFVAGSIFAAVYIASYIADPADSSSPFADPSSINVVLYLMNLLIFVLYYTIMEGALKGRTIGKLITGTVAMREDGSKLTWKNAFFRSLVRVIPFEPLVALFTNYPWHDDFTNTVVVKKQA